MLDCELCNISFDEDLSTDDPYAIEYHAYAERVSLKRLERRDKELEEGYGGRFPGGQPPAQKSPAIPTKSFYSKE